eukprot:sb/3468357/
MIDSRVFEAYPDSLLGSPDIDQFYCLDRRMYFIEHSRHIFEKVARFYTHGDALTPPCCIPKDFFERSMEFYRLTNYYKHTATTPLDVIDPKTWREKVYASIFMPEYSKLSLVYNLVDTVIIVMSTIFFILETIQGLGEGIYRASKVVNVIVNVHVLIQLIMLLLVHPNKLELLKSPFTWIDLIVLSTFLVEKIFTESYQNFGVFRILRLFRVSIVTKLLRMSNSGRNMLAFLNVCRPELGLIFIILAMAVLIFGPLCGERYLP